MTHLQPILEDLLVGVRHRAARRRRARAAGASALATVALAAFAFAAAAPTTTGPAPLPADPGAAGPLTPEHPADGTLVASPFAQTIAINSP